MASNHSSLDEVYSYVKSILKFAQNSDTVAQPSFDLNFRHICISGKGLEFLGASLRCNTKIEVLKIDTDSCPSFSEEQVEDLCYFIANNPSLKSLWFFGRLYGDDEVLNMGPALACAILQAAATNKNLKELRIDSGFDDIISKHIGSFTSISILSIVSDLDNRFVEAFPAFHTLTTLELLGESTASMFTKLMSTETSVSVKNLELELWNPSVALFLTSKNSSIQSLTVNELNNSDMDSLLWGLMGSRSTEHLKISGDLNVSALAKLAHTLKNSLLPVKRLDLVLGHRAASESDAYVEFLRCKFLESLRLSHNRVVSSGLKEAIADCEVPGLSFEGIRFEEVGQSLIDSLTRKKLQSLQFKMGCKFNDDDADLLTKIITDDDCQLKTLEIYGEFNATEHGSFGRKLVASLSKSSNLRNFRMLPDSSRDLEALLRDIATYVGDIANLECVEMWLNNDVVSAETESSLEAALTKNWSLEVFRLYEYDADFDQMTTNAITSPRFGRKVDAIMNRNKLKKEILNLEPVSVTKQQCCNLLKEFLNLPDEVSLSFWLLELMPNMFFQHGSDDSPRPTKRRRRRHQTL